MLINEGADEDGDEASLSGVDVLQRSGELGEH